MANETYDHSEIEKSAREKWESLGLYTTDLTNSEKDPYYLLVEFPYPSGDLHTGHWYAYAMPDIYARYLRMKGENVLFPFGFDAFGLPAENAAIKRGIDPREWTYGNMDRMREQVKSMGVSFDWSREVVTCDPEYYRWTQWLFSKFYEQGLAERKEAAVKWCPKDQTVLANEQVIDGHCARCGSIVEERLLTQWFLKITKYAKRLLEDLDPLPWREEIKDAQRAWIGESEGARLFFELGTTNGESLGTVEVFTTRPDTVYGATYVVLAPENPLVNKLLPHVTNKGEAEMYRLTTSRKTERERSENKEKTGIELKGIHAINPATKSPISMYLADYVFASYGTGAVMAVPAHDERDFEFAQKYNLPIVHVVEPKFTATADELGALKPGEEIVRREAVCVVVRNPKDDTYLCISWKKEPMNGLVTGGIEEGEDLVEAARREILEETGYKNLRHIDRPMHTVNTFFWHRLKKQNRWAHFHYVFFDLENEEREPVADEESAQHEVVWKKKSELKDFFTVFEGTFITWLLDSPEFVYTAPGILTNSGPFTGQESEEAKWQIAEAVGGERVTNYRVRDWLVSRQRYWGCPIPIVYDPEGTPHIVPAEHLPWTLPEDVDFTPTGKSPLASSKELHERVERIFGKGWTPEYDTLDVFVDSAWYYTRYLDNKNSQEFSNQGLMKKWLPVNRYTGGAEHTTVHLLYARFFYKALHDMALVPTPEPFIERMNRGIILGPDHQKMSKSRGNVINPDELVTKYGADAVRMYLAFIGPYNEPGQYPWNLDGVESMRRFLDRIARLLPKLTDTESAEQIGRAVGKAIQKVAEDIERFKFNTAISAMMIALKEVEDQKEVSRTLYTNFVQLLAPFAPHLAEHLWNEAGQEGSVHAAAWPEAQKFDDELVTVIVQINGKKRGETTLAPDATEEMALEAAKKIEAVSKQLSGKKPQKIIYVPGRILNLVVPS